MLKLISEILNYADKIVDTPEDDGWSWRFLRGSKPPQQ